MTLRARTRAVRAVEKIEKAQAELARAVADLRAEGASWAAISTILGVSRQAAWKRFGEEAK